ncbi:MAG TPA: helix-turn-helix domain-containing protein [Blastocatellia bacterium]
MGKAKKTGKRLTTGQVAARLGVLVSTVRKWARNGRFEGAERVESPWGSGWLIPEEALSEFRTRKPGRPKRSAADE